MKFMLTVILFFYFAALSSVGLVLGAQLERLGMNQGNEDISQTFKDFGELVKKTEEQRQKIANEGFTKFIDGLNVLNANLKPELSELTSSASGKEKAARAAIDKCEQQTKKLKKDQDKLKEAIGELNKKIQEYENVLATNLRDVTGFQRKRYCTIASSLVPIIESIMKLGALEKDDMKKQRSKIKKLGDAAEKLSKGVENLTRKKVRTLQKLNITSDWKKVFQDAGVKKSDLDNEETAKMILGIIEKETGEKIELPPDEAYESDDMTAPPEPSIPPPPPPPQSDSEGNCPPPPPPPTCAADAPPPLPARDSSRANLLDEIHKGTLLRKTPQQVNLPTLNDDQKKNDITSLLKNAMASRRPAIAEDEDGNDEEDEWTD